LRLPSVPFRRWAVPLVGVCFLTSPAYAGDAPSRPNLIVLLADDLGYGDLGCYNPASKIPTPNLDRLAKEGMRFTDAHAPSAVCTPTRYALLTGRYAWRTRLQRGVLAPFDPPLIDPKTLTVPALLKHHGYATACIGKWHLGWDWPKPDAAGQRDFTRPLTNGPTARGFDTYFGVDLPNYPPYVFIEQARTVGIPSEPALLAKGGFNRAGPMRPGWKLVEILPEVERRAVAKVEELAKAGTPFFMYLPLTSPHYPIVPAPAFVGRSGAGAYGDFVMQTDHVVGRVLDALKRAGAADDTLVVFTSDNGPEVTGEVANGAYDRLREFGHASMGDLRGAKRDAWEGGHRVPLIARWPGRVKPGTTSEEPVCHVDLMATMAAVLGVTLPADAGVDGASLLPVFRGEARDGPVHEAIVTHSGSGKFAIRKGPWVLIAAPSGDDNGKNGEPDWFRKDRRIEVDAAPGQLFHVADDAGQKHNRYPTEGAVVRDLAAVLDRYVADGRSTPGPKRANDVAVTWDRRGKPKGQ
jgi:arylsulfatase A-like enzyme